MKCALIVRFTKHRPNIKGDCRNCSLQLTWAALLKWTKWRHFRRMNSQDKRIEVNHVNCGWDLCRVFMSLVGKKFNRLRYIQSTFRLHFSFSHSSRARQPQQKSTKLWLMMLIFHNNLSAKCITPYCILRHKRLLLLSFDRYAIDVSVAIVSIMRTILIDNVFPSLSACCRRAESQWGP